MFVNDSIVADYYGYGENDAQGVRYTVTLSNPDFVQTRTFEWNSYNWEKPIIPLWNNTGVSGEFANVNGIRRRRIP